MVVRDAVVTIFVWGLENGKQPIEQHKNITGSSFEKMTNYIELQYKIRASTGGTIFAQYKTNLLPPIDGSKWDSQKMLYKGQTKCQKI